MASKPGTRIGPCQSGYDLNRVVLCVDRVKNVPDFGLNRQSPLFDIYSWSGCGVRDALRDGVQRKANGNGSDDPHAASVASCGSRFAAVVTRRSRRTPSAFRVSRARSA
jgi:hypothetical protein